MNDSIQKNRSPNCPALPLSDAVERLKTLHAKIGRSKVNRESAVIALGYNGLNGRALGTLGALAQYGLIVNERGEVSIAQLALSILHPLDAEKKAKAIAEAALYPKVFKDIFEASPDVSEDVLTNMLVHKDFTEDAAKRSASIYKANFVFANLGNSSTVPNVDPATAAAETDKNKNPSGMASAKPPFSGGAASHPHFNPPPPASNVLDTFKVPVGLANAEIIFTGTELAPEDFDALADYMKIFKAQFVRKQKAEALKTLLQSRSAPNPPVDNELATG